MCPTSHRCAGMEVNRQGRHLQEAHMLKVGRQVNKERNQVSRLLIQGWGGAKGGRWLPGSRSPWGRQEGSRNPWGDWPEPWNSRSRERAAQAAGARGWKARWDGRMLYVWGTARGAFTGLEHGHRDREGDKDEETQSLMSQVSHTDTWLQNSDSPALLPLQQIRKPWSACTHSPVICTHRGPQGADH